MPESTLLHITLLRHGESVGNIEQRFQGQSEYPLTVRGMSQAQALAERWRAAGVRYDLCLSSPLQRARQTAETIAASLNVPVELADDWMEVDNGKLAGLNDEEAATKVPRPPFMTPYDHFGETGESRMELYLRAGKAIQDLVDRGPGRYLVVSHGGILNMALYSILGIPLHADSQGPRFIFGNTGFCRLTYDPGRHSWRLWELDNSGDGLT